MTDETNTTGAAPVAAATPAPIVISMPTTPTPIKDFFEKLLNEIEAIPGEVTVEISSGKLKIRHAIGYIEAHFRSAKTTA
jgi:hypothetical protein